MRVLPRTAAGGLAALVVGFVLSLAAASWLRSAVDGGGLLWRVATTTDVAAWIQTASHGVPIGIEAGAEVTSDRLRGVTDRLGDLFDRDLTPQVAAHLRVVLAPLTILLATGAVLFTAGRRSRAGSLTDAAAGAVAAGTVYGVGIAVLAAASRASIGLDGRLVRAGVDVGASPTTALIAGLLWGTALTAIGAMTTTEARARLSAGVRAIADAWARALGAGAVAAGVGLALWAAYRGARGDAPSVDASVLALGAALLAPNAVAAALVLSHGASMDVSLDVGALAGWARLDYLNVGPSGDPAPAGWWLFLAVPVVAGVVAGRALSRRGERSPAAALAFGVLWAATLAGLSALLRVEVLSSFAVGSLGSGGSAAPDALEALVFGLGWGTLGALAGMRLPTPTQLERAGGRPPPVAVNGQVAAPVATPAAVGPTTRWPCASCGHANVAGDRFCVACGRPAG